MVVKMSRLLRGHRVVEYPVSQIVQTVFRLLPKLKCHFRVGSIDKVSLAAFRVGSIDKVSLAAFRVGSLDKVSLAAFRVGSLDKVSLAAFRVGSGPSRSSDPLSYC